MYFLHLLTVVYGRQARQRTVLSSSTSKAAKQSVQKRQVGLLTRSRLSYRLQRRRRRRPRTEPANGIRPWHLFFVDVDCRPRRDKEPDIARLTGRSYLPTRNGSPVVWEALKNLHNQKRAVDRQNSTEDRRNRTSTRKRRSRRY